MGTPRDVTSIRVNVRSALPRQAKGDALANLQARLMELGVTPDVAEEMAVYLVGEMGIVISGSEIMESETVKDLLELVTRKDEERAKSEPDIVANSMIG